MSCSWISWRPFFNWGSFLFDDYNLCQVYTQSQPGYWGRGITFYYNTVWEKNLFTMKKKTWLLVLGFLTLMLNDNKFSLFKVTAFVALVYHFKSSIKLIQMISLELCSGKNPQINKTENYTGYCVCYFPYIQVFLRPGHGNYLFPFGWWRGCMCKSNLYVLNQLVDEMTIS